MQAAFPNTVLIKIANRKEPFVHTRSDGRHVIFGFSSTSKAELFRRVAHLTDREPNRVDPVNLLGWLRMQNLPEDTVLALDAQDPHDELQAVEVARAIRVIQSQGSEGWGQVEYSHYPADRVPEKAR